MNNSIRHYLIVALLLSAVVAAWGFYLKFRPQFIAMSLMQPNWRIQQQMECTPWRPPPPSDQYADMAVEVRNCSYSELFFTSTFRQLRNYADNRTQWAAGTTRVQVNFSQCSVGFILSIILVLLAFFLWVKVVSIRPYREVLPRAHAHVLFEAAVTSTLPHSIVDYAIPPFIERNNWIAKSSVICGVVSIFGIPGGCISSRFNLFMITIALAAITLGAITVWNGDNAKNDTNSWRGNLGAFLGALGFIGNFAIISTTS